MGTNFNFKNFVNGAPPNGGGGAGRQSSVYSLTFDEFQTTIGGIGKDFGSMNIDELLKNIWSAEQIQDMELAATQTDVTSDVYLQKQGSLTLPRTLSQKTVDEVWKDMSKDFPSNGVESSCIPHRQQTLGETTLEEFLVRTGVVREDICFGSGFGGRILDSINQISVDSTNLPLNVNEVSNAQQLFVNLPKPASYGAKMAKPSSNPLSNGGMNARIVGISDCLVIGSPSASLDGHGKSNGDASSVSPVPYAFSTGGVVQGRKSNGFEKVVERRQKRMIKNRESAARSRARKQAYTMELEAEVAKLKEENQELRKKQAMETMNEQHGSKRRRYLKRTHTGPCST